MMGSKRISLEVFLLAGIMSAKAFAAVDVAPVTTKSILCHADRSQPTAGDNYFSEHNYVQAEAFFRAALHLNAADDEARLGLVRTLLSENRIAETKNELEAWQMQKSTLAEVATGEVAYREADISMAVRSASNAVSMGHCDGRALALEASIEVLDAKFEREAMLLQFAHELRPNDELIQRAWMKTLQPPEHARALRKYLSDTPHLSTEDAEALKNELQELEIHRPGECRVSGFTSLQAIPLRAIYNAEQAMAYGVDARFNGVSRRLEVDTGSSGFILTAKAAKRLGLKQEFYLPTHGAGDAAQGRAYRTHVDQIRIGFLVFSDCVVDVLESSRLRSDGLIGADVFAPWLVTLNYPEEKLQLSTLPKNPTTSARPTDEPKDGETVLVDAVDLPHDRYVAPEMTDWLKVFRIGHALLIPGRIDHGPMHFFIADSGSSETTFSLALAHETHREYVEFGTQMWGVTGDIKQLYRVDNTVLQFGPYRLPPARYHAFDYTGLLQQTGFEVSGLLGFPTLSTMKISIDFRDNLMQMASGASEKHGTRAAR